MYFATAKKSDMRDDECVFVFSGRTKNTGTVSHKNIVGQIGVVRKKAPEGQSYTWPWFNSKCTVQALPKFVPVPK